MFSARPTTNRIGLAIQKSIQYKQQINSWDKNIKKVSFQMTLENSISSIITKTSQVTIFCYISGLQ